MPVLSNVRFTAYVPQATFDLIVANQRDRPIGRVIVDAVALLPPIASEPSSPVKALLARKTDRVPVRPYAGPPPALKAQRSVKGPHPPSCPCDACTLARLEAPQVKGK